MSKKIKDIYSNLVFKINKRLKRKDIFKLIISLDNGIYEVNNLDRTKSKEEIDKIIQKAKVV